MPVKKIIGDNHYKSISHYNDRCRKALLDFKEQLKLNRKGCLFQVVKTAGFNHSFQLNEQQEIFELLATFDDFNEDNDPYGEHDFIRIEYKRMSIILKFVYYAPDLEHGSEDAEDLAKTVRVMTIMLQSDY